MTSIFEHIQAPVPDDCIFKISPSSIGSFFDFPSIWYKDNILGEKQFTGSTASTIGTCVHYVAEQYALGNRVTREFMEAQIDSIDDPTIDKEEVKEAFPELAKLLINDYVRLQLPSLVEHSVYAEVFNKVYVAGTIDVIKKRGIGTKNEIWSIEDYKTSSSKPSDTMPFGYKVQQLSYAYALRKQGITVDKISLIYVVRPTKTLPARLFPIHHIITPADWKLIEDTLQLIAESVIAVKEHPELTHLIFKSMSLKV